MVGSVREDVLLVVRRYGVSVRYVKVYVGGGSLYVKLYADGPVPHALIAELADLLSKHGKVYIHAPHRNAIRLEAKPT